MQRGLAYFRRADLKTVMLPHPPAARAKGMLRAKVRQHPLKPPAFAMGMHPRTRRQRPHIGVARGAPHALLYRHRPDHAPPRQLHPLFFVPVPRHKARGWQRCTCLPADPVPPVLLRAAPTDTSSDAPACAPRPPPDLLSRLHPNPHPPARSGASTISSNASKRSSNAGCSFNLSTSPCALSPQSTT